MLVMPRVMGGMMCLVRFVVQLGRFGLRRRHEQWGTNGGNRQEQDKLFHDMVILETFPPKSASGVV